MLKHERGFGLVEVLVALMLLAVAVLGFSALQMRAIQATDETLIRSDAMVMIRNISEDMRLYADTSQKETYKTALANPLSNKDCSRADCNADEQLRYNAKQMKELADSSGIELTAHNCPQAVGRMCVIAAWGDTRASVGANDKTDCLTTDGTYHPRASCIVMEAY